MTVSYLAATKMAQSQTISGAELRARIDKLGLTYTATAPLLGLTLDGLRKQMSGLRPVSRQTKLLLDVIERRQSPRRPKTKVVVSAADVQVFFNFCVYVRSIYLHNQILFDDKIQNQLLDRLAPICFGDLGLMLREYLILQVCKVADPATDIRGNENYTTDFFTENSDFTAVPARGHKLDVLNKRIHNFRDKLKPARDKIISHIDRETVKNGKNLGAAMDSEWNAFWSDLDEFVGLIYEHFCGRRESVIDLPRLSDAEFVVRALKESTYFHELWGSTDPTISNKCTELAMQDFA